MNAKRIEAIMRLLQDDEEKKPEITKPLFRIDPSAYIEKIVGLKKSLEQPTKFKVDDLIIWKEGLRNRKYPDYNQPCIVLKIHDELLKDDDTEVGDMYDIQIGLSIIDEDDGEDVFLIFNVSSYRYTLYRPDDAIQKTLP